jgi:hypothetical protein
MANKIIIIIVVALIVMMVLSLTAKDEGYYADNTTLKSNVNGGKMTQPLVNGNYSLALQDKILAIYGPSQKVLWSVPSSPGSSLVMQSDGNLVLYDSSNDPNPNPIWNARSGSRGVGPYTLTLFPDGNTQIIDSNNTIIQNDITKYYEFPPICKPDHSVNPCQCPYNEARDEYAYWC